MAILNISLQVVGSVSVATGTVNKCTTCKNNQQASFCAFIRHCCLWFTLYLQITANIYWQNNGDLLVEILPSWSWKQLTIW